MDANSEITPKDVGAETAVAPKKDRWAFLKEAKAKLAEKFIKLKPTQNVRKKLAQAALVGMMQIDDTGAYMVQTKKIPESFVPASIGAEVMPPDSPDPEPHAKKPEVTISGNPPEHQNPQQM